jgi:MscS family membrane protein
MMACRSAIRRASILVLGVVALLWPAVVVAEPLPAATPRMAVMQFLELSRRGDDAGAAQFLELDASTQGRGPELARKLKSVLDRHAWIDLDRVSNATEGDLDDHLDEDLEEVARIPSPTSGEEPVRLHRGAGRAWRFAASTVARVDDWYRGLPGRWMLELLPSWAQRPGPYDLLLWQWLVLPVLLTLGWIIGAILGRLTRGVAHRLVRRTQVQWDDKLLDVMAGALRWGWTVLVLRAAIPLLGLYAPASRGINGLLGAAMLLVLFWGLVRFIDVVGRAMTTSRWASNLPASRALVPLGTRVTKAVVVVIAVITMLSQLGYPVASLIAGLGIGGIALALAAQKTVENLFGAFSIGVDQPFREGDTVKIEDFVGTVEAVGLRSTRIRTADRTLITMPNAKVAEARIESFAARDRIRFSHTIGLVYETSGAQMRSILGGFEHVLRQQSRIWPDSVVVRFMGFGACSLDIEVACWFETTNYDEYRLFREEVLLGFMAVVEAAGSAFAYPTHTVHVVNERPKRAADAPRPERGRDGVTAEAEDEVEQPGQDRNGGVARADGDDPEPVPPPGPERAP